MKNAMKAKDASTLDTIRMLMASIKNKAIDLGHELEDADVMAVIKADAKKIKDSLESFVANARLDLAEKARTELKVLEAYLPQQIGDEELEARVRAKLQELGVVDASGMGKAMGAIMADLRDVADGGRIKAMVDKVLKG